MTTKMTGAVRKDGGWALIGTQEASDDASLTQTGLSSDYDTYVVGMSSVVPQTDDQALYMRLGDSSGIDSGASDYVYVYQIYQEGNTIIGITDGTASSYMRVCNPLGTGSEEGGSYMFWIMNPGDAGVRPTVYGYQATYSAVPELRGGHFYGMREAVITLDRIQLYMASGNIVSGRMTVWGISHE